MLYIILGIAGLLITVALFTFLFKRKNTAPEEIHAPAEGCCGAHAICEKGLKKIETHIEYFEDEELDAFRGITTDQYTDEQIDIFRDILYTLQKEEVADWLISLEKRGINLPLILRQEALDLL